MVPPVFCCDAVTHCKVIACSRMRCCVASQALQHRRRGCERSTLASKLTWLSSCGRGPNTLTRRCIARPHDRHRCRSSPVGRAAAHVSAALGADRAQPRRAVELPLLLRHRTAALARGDGDHLMITCASQTCVDGDTASESMRVEILEPCRDVAQFDAWLGRHEQRAEVDTHRPRRREGPGSARFYLLRHDAPAVCRCTHSCGNSLGCRFSTRPRRLTVKCWRESSGEHACGDRATSQSRDLSRLLSEAARQ